jgi:hypothetical protein
VMGIISIANKRKIEELQNAEMVLLRHFRSSPAGSWKNGFALRKIIECQTKIKVIKELEMCA